MSEAELRTRVLALRAEMTTLAALRTNPDPAQRLAGGERLLGSDIELLVEAAFQLLGGSGKAAVPVLVAQLDGEHFHDALDALAAIGDPSAVAPVLERLEREIAFWTDAKPRLVNGSWQQASREEQDTYEMHVVTTHTLLTTLKHMPSRAYEDAVRRLRALWREPPAIRELPGSLIERACGEALLALEPLPASTK